MLVVHPYMVRSNLVQLGAHQRAVHGGGVFDEDFIVPAFKRADEKESTKDVSGQYV